MFFGKKKAVEAPIIHANDDDFDTIIAEHSGVTVVDFGARMCLRPTT